MEYEVACNCGNVLLVSDGMAGASTCCSCGRAVPIPALSELRAREITGAAPPAASEIQHPDETPPRPNPHVEIISPTQIILHTVGGGQPDRHAPVMIALTPQAIWIQDTWQLRPVPLQSFGITRGRNSRELTLILGAEPSAETLTLTFVSDAERERWYKEVQVLQQQLTPAAPQDDRHQPEGVAMVRQAPQVPHVVIGRVEFLGPTHWAADRGLQIRAGMRGADAIIEVQRRNCPELKGARHVSGLAVRVENADSRNWIRLGWYGEEVCALVNRMLLLLVFQAALLLLASVSGISGLQAPTGETRSQAIASTGLGLALFYAWPLVLLALLRVLRWPQLLRTAGLATLAATTGRGLTVWLAHLLAIRTTGVTLAESKIWILADPVDWAFVIAGLVLCKRAWRLASEARQMLPREMQVASTARKAWSRGLLALTGVYVLVLLGFAGDSRYHASAYVLQRGVDPRREQEALLALNQGLAQSDKGDLASAEQSFQRALKLWEQLTARPSIPPGYRTELACTLNNLGWLRERQGRANEAEPYYVRALTLEEPPTGDARIDAESKRIMAYARDALAALRGGKADKLLDEKDQAGVRKYEEAQVKAQQGGVEAERLYTEAITLWEEVLPQATDEIYRKSAVARLATAYVQLGGLQQKLGKRPAAESTLKKGIEYGEKALAMEPDRPLRKHNLELARQMLEGVREQSLQEEVTKLCGAERFADAIDLSLRSIEEQEEQVRSGKDRDAAVRRLAFRLNRFAWFQAHCPDKRFRDATTAVKHARRATELQPDVGDFWYTLAMVQYRNGDWRDSLASLEKVKAKENGLDASGWFLSAMNSYRLKRTEDARAAMQKGGEWIDKRKLQAEDNPVLRFQYEMMRSAIEALRQEAENLIEGKDPFNRVVG